MNRDQFRFLAMGILFGFLVGYIIAYAIHEPRVKQTAAPVPAAGNLGMGSVVGSAPPQGGPAVQQGAGGHGEAMMEEIAALKAALEQNPADLPALVRLANLNHDSGKFAEAVEMYARALEIRPDDVNVRTDMAICLREVGQVDEALAEFRNSLTHDPEHWQTWLNLGIVSLFDRQDVKTAGEAFAQVEKFNPGFKDLPRLKEAVRQAGEAPPGS